MVIKKRNILKNELSTWLVEVNKDGGRVKSKGKKYYPGVKMVSENESLLGVSRSW